MFADLWEMYVERRKIRIVLGIVAVFLVSMVMSCQELRYMVSGKTTDAKLEQSRLDRVGGTDEAPRYKRVITLSFMDKDTFRREYLNVPLDWSPKHADMVKVEYFSGTDFGVRIYGDRQIVWVIIFLGSILLLIIWVIKIVRTQ